jgi:hypothetical protein
MHHHRSKSYDSRRLRLCRVDHRLKTGITAAHQKDVMSTELDW